MFTGFLFYIFITSIVLSRVDGQGFLGDSAPANMIIVNFVIDQQNKNLRLIAIVVSPNVWRCHRFYIHVNIMQMSLSLYKGGDRPGSFVQFPAVIWEKIILGQPFEIYIQRIVS